VCKVAEVEIYDLNLQMQLDKVHSNKHKMCSGCFLSTSLKKKTVLKADRAQTEQFVCVCVCVCVCVNTGSLLH